MLKYGQEDLSNLWQMGFQSTIRLILLSLSIGGVATLLWWSWHAPKNSFYYLFHYSYSWLYCKIPFGCSQVAMYNQQVLQPIIDQMGEVLRSCGTVFSVTSFLCTVGLRYYFIKYSQKLEKERYLRGSRLLKTDELNVEIDSARTPQGKLKYESTSQDLYLGREKVRLPHALTFRHLVAVGVSGTGKTQLINSLLKQLEGMRRQKCLVLDLNGQYYSRFGQDGDKILSLYDTRSQAWSFYGENVPPEFFAQALVEINNSNPFFGNAGRALMTDIISRNSIVSQVWQDLTSDKAELLEKLKGGISPSLLGAPEQAAGVISSASVEMNFLRHLNHSNSSQEFFSLTDWVLSPSEDWVFLIVKDIDLAATKPLLRLWVDLVVGGVLQREENNEYPHLWVVCDELPGLGVLPSLGKLLSQGRKYKSSLIAGYQVREQIEHLYGKEGGKEILAGLQNKIIFRTPDPDSAKKESLTLGEQEVIEVTSSGQLGEAGESDRNSLQRNVKTRLVVMPSEVQNLADMKAYIKICEFDPCQISLDPQSLPQINEPSVRYLPPSSGATSLDDNLESTNAKDDDQEQKSKETHSSTATEDTGEAQELSKVEVTNAAVAEKSPEYQLQTQEIGNTESFEEYKKAKNVDDDLPWDIKP